MRLRLIVTAFFLFNAVFTSYSQELKKKYAGNYEGELPGYVMYIGEQTVNVAPCVVTVAWFPNAPFVQKLGGKFEQKGTWKITFMSKTVYRIEVLFNEQQVVEQFEFDRKTKTLTRIGLFPQSNAALTRKAD